MWPLSWQGMVYTFTKTDNTVAALDIPSNITVKIITMNNNQCITELSFLRSHHLLSYSFNSLSSTQHISSLDFHHSLSPSHPIPLAHTPSVLTYILHWTTSLLQPKCSVHFKHNADTPKWGTKLWDTDKSTNPFSNEPISNSYNQHLIKLQLQTSPTLS